MKTFILIFLVILFCCVNGIRAQGDKIIDMGTYSVRAPKGDDWDIRIEKEKGKVEFSREKGELLSFLSGRIQGATLITVFRNWVGWMRWNKSEEETANHYRDNEEKMMIEKGIKLRDVKKGVTNIGEKRIYFMTYGKEVFAEDYQKYDVESALYLLFPADFNQRHIFFGFIISELVGGGFVTADFAQLKVLIKSFREISPLESIQGIDGEFLRAAAEGKVSMVTELLEKGADMNAQSTVGTALIISSLYGHKDVVNLLIDKGANIDLKDELTGRTALMNSIKGGEPEITKLLIENGADVNAVDKGGGTPLMFSSVMRQIEITKLLLEKGANMNARNERGHTVLFLASGSGNFETVIYLLDQGVDINAKDDYGGTALMEAINFDYSEIAKLLIERGADVNLKSIDGWTSLMGAVIRGNTEIVKLLIEKGADVNARNKKDSSVLKIAKSYKQKEIVKLLKDAGAKE